MNLLGGMTEDAINEGSLSHSVLAGFGVEQAQSFLGLGVVGIDLQNLLVMRHARQGSFISS